MLDEATSAADRLFLLIQGFRVSRMIRVAAQLGLADLLADGPKTAEELASAVDCDAPSLNRMLRALASLGVFARHEDGHFALTPLSQLLRDGVPSSLRSFALHFTEGEEHEVWYDLLYSMRTGEPAFPHRYGAGFFDYLASHPESAAAFNARMTGRVGASAAAVARAYDFSSSRLVLDVGGGHGAVLRAVLAAHPHLRGILFDLPDVVEGARRELAAAGLVERCDLVGGSFFDRLPDGADTAILCDILHDWDDEHCRQILATCRRALPAGGRLLLVEAVMPPDNTPFRVAALDLHMLLLFGARQRTEVEFRALLAEAGFALERIIPTSAPRDIVVARAV
jgi:ubiquinone/menaquinone biosynthesis C-methylase UbiE